MAMRCRWSARGLTAPGYRHGARGRDDCGIRNPRRVSRTRRNPVAVERECASERYLARVRAATWMAIMIAWSADCPPEDVRCSLMPQIYVTRKPQWR